ncbi:hypothetical protein HDU84_003592 [Entophlyctis sp. JEL0112]|nr:hypothetical protein HDU84_003592 [Entophlyctis sp. JEL0112]
MSSLQGDTSPTLPFPRMWTPHSKQVPDLSAVLSAADLGAENDVGLLTRVAQVVSENYGVDAVHLPSSYVASPMSHVYLTQRFRGLPLLNTQMHCIVANGRIVRMNSSFVRFDDIKVEEDGESLLADVSGAVNAQFGASSSEWLEPGFGDSGVMGFYLTDGGVLVKAWQFNSASCSVVAKAADGVILGFSPFMAS